VPYTGIPYHPLEAVRIAGLAGDVMFEPDYKCKLCHDNGYVHPVVRGFVQYDRTIWCKCQPKAGQAAHKADSPARLAYKIEFFNTGLNDYLYQSNCGRVLERPLEPEPQTDLRPIKEELEVINNRLNEIPVKKQPGAKKGTLLDE
jgi:hypothetical protein